MLCQGHNLDSLKTVAIASRATRDVEKRCPQLVLEALAVDDGLRKMRIYLEGNPDVTVITDHKPLLPILRGKRTRSARTQRIVLQHQDIVFKLIWQEGKANPPDLFSRHPTPLSQLSHAERKTPNQLGLAINLILDGDICRALTPFTMQYPSCKDAVLTSLIGAILQGQLRTETRLAPFRKVFAELTLSGRGCGLRGERLLLPKKLYAKAIALAHFKSHLGASAKKRRL